MGVHLVADDAFWHDLTDRAHVLSGREVDALSAFDDAAFGAMLTACGYHSPPPPLVDELVADTRYALGLAVSSGTRPDLVEEARRQLQVFLLRSRRQLLPGRGSPTAPADSLARRVGRVARRYIPVAVGVAVGAAVESVIPTGLALGGALALSRAVEQAGQGLAGKAAEEVATRAAEWAVGSLVGETVAESSHEAAHADDTRVVSRGQAISAHLDLARHVLGPGAAPTAARVEQALIDARRVQDLAGDEGAPTVVRDAAAFAVEALGGGAAGAVPDTTVAFEALQLAGRAWSSHRGIRPAGTPGASPDQAPSGAVEIERELCSLMRGWRESRDPCHGV